MDRDFQISVLGSLRVTHKGQELPLPRSRKSRALLGYLAIQGKRQRRERLCELFWEDSENPRAALRWSLSKLRSATTTSGVACLDADQHHIALRADRCVLDLDTVRALLDSGVDELDLAALKSLYARTKRPVLDGLELHGTSQYHWWLTAIREELRALHTQVVQRLCAASELPVHEMLVYASNWLQQQPLSEQAAQALHGLLMQLGRAEEAQAVEREFRQLAAQQDMTVADDLFEPGDDRAALSRQRRSGKQQQKIGFCSARDGVRIAYATVGSGPPLVKAANWLNHLELDWDSPIWGETFHECAKNRTFIRYDERGNGLSDWDVPEISQAVFVEDLEAVVDHLGLERFPLLGISQGCAVSIEYAVRHPQRVSALVLISGYATGWRKGVSAEEQEKREAVITLTKHGWGTNNPAYRHIFSQTFMPDARGDDLDWFDEFQRQTTSAENSVRFQNAFGDIDVSDMLHQVAAPTIVFHSEHDQRISIDQGRALAAGIPDARFVGLNSKNHILLGHEPAWSTCFSTMDQFLKEHGI